MSINQKQKGRFVKVNRQITSPQVRVKDRGIMSTQQAIDLAFSEGLDLVEIAPHVNPPVCEIIDFGKWRFDEKKRQKEQKSNQKITKAKEIRLRPLSEDHDVVHKIEQLKKFLEEKKQVLVNMRFKNREMTYNRDRGKEVIEKIIKAVDDLGKVDHPPRFEGTTLSVRFTPK